MSLSRRLLYASDIWEIVRPRTALTAGHLLIRLTNPAVAFDLRSAADWLLCHNAARRALAEVLGATRCTVLFAHQWHPIGASIGEPEVESSTPTFHLFGRWDGEPVTPGDQLLLPTQRRVPASADGLVEYDGGLRAALRRLTVERSAAASEIPEDVPLPGLAASPPPAKAGPHHIVLSPESDGPLTSGHLLALAAALQGLTERRGVTGLSCVVPDPGSGRLEVHALGRSAGESVNPLQEFLALPKVSQALL
jgi:hypothetical protein